MQHDLELKYESTETRMVVEDFKTMRFTESPEHRTHYYGVSVCTVCHGALFPKLTDSSDLTDLPCPFCDDEQPLSRQYQMALDTVAWECDVPLDYVSTEPCGFPSFVSVIARPDRVGPFVYLRLHAGRGVAVATPMAIQVPCAQEGGDGLIMLDGVHSLLDDPHYPCQQGLAREVVRLCKHDLKLKYAKEA